VNPADCSKWQQQHKQTNVLHTLSADTKAHLANHDEPIGDVDVLVWQSSPPVNQRITSSVPSYKKEIEEMYEHLWSTFLRSFSISLNCS